jgi:hypothetical protein
MSFHDKELNIINTERIPRYDKTFFNKITGKKFKTDEVKMMKYRRNKILKNFHQEFKESKYTWLEIGLDFTTTTRIADVLLKLNRNLKKINLKTLSYVWLVDKGREHGNMHFHLLVCVDKIDLKGKQLPKELKLSFKDRKVHSSFVTNKNWWIRYLKKKPIFYIGKRKRVYGKSRYYYNNSSEVPSTIQNKKSSNI